MLNIHGPEPAVSHVAALDGNVARSTLSTNFVGLGLAIFAGALLGLALTFPVGGLRIVLGS
jgi:putative transport protein